MNRIKFIGMDVHKKTITIAIADEGPIPSSEKPEILSQVYSSNLPVTG